MRSALVLLTLLPTLAASQWHQPLDVRIHRSANLAFLRFTPRSHTVTQNGRYLSLSFVAANEFRRAGLIDEDAEVYRPNLLYGEGLGSYEVWVEAPLIVRGGGVMDPIIEWWHGHVIRFPDASRESTPQGRSTVSFPGSGGPYGSAVSLGDVSLGLAREVQDGVIGRVGVKLPTGNPTVLAGSGGVDIGGAVDWRIRLHEDWTLDLNGALVFQGAAARLEDVRSTVYSSSIAVTWQQSSKDAWTVQWNAEQSPTRTGVSNADADHRLLSFGYQRWLPDGSVFQLYFSEDGDFLSFPGGPTYGPDLTVGARIFKSY